MTDYETFRLSQFALAANRIQLCAFRVTVNGGVPAHDHDFIELALVAGGTGQHRSQSGETDLHAGDLVVLRPGAWHEFVICKDLIVYNCCFELDLIEKQVALALRQPSLNYLFWAGPLSPKNRGVLIEHIGVDGAGDCEHQLRQLIISLTGSSESDVLESAAHFLLLLAGIGRRIQTPAVLSITAAADAVIQCRGLLEDDFSREWTLRELAKQVHLAPEYLVRIFKRETGLPPIAYLNQRRAERAAQLLVRTTMGVSQVGAQVGWLDASYFSRCFRKSFAMSPTEYRQRFSG